MREEHPPASPPWIRTPCIYNEALSKAAGWYVPLASLSSSFPSPSAPRPPPCPTGPTPANTASNIYLKLENLQPSGSFKSRGIGNLISRSAARAHPSYPPHFYCSSGGNAGLACITAARSLSLPATIVVPLSTPAPMVAKIRGLGASVHQVGASWAEADEHMRTQLMSKDEMAIYVPPFDHPEIWTGAATLVDELVVQMEGPVHGIACSVGGGGLLNGIMQGLDTLSWSAGRKPRVLAVETEGADSLNLCVRTGSHAKLDAITSIATSLGARQVSKRSYEWLASENLSSIVVKDWEAGMGCVRFADDARLVVEAACGATIAPAYFGGEGGVNRLRRAFEVEGVEWKEHNVVLVVCGGSNVSLSVLERYKEKYGGMAEAAGAPAGNGESTNGTSS